MATLNPEHLFEQATELVAPPGAGAPRQVDLRRAISAAYYGVFHFALTALADEFVGKTQRTSSRYTLVYRSVDHRALKDLCNEAKKPTLPARYLAYLPEGGFGPNIQAFAAAVADLQEKRHAADYNPQPRFTINEARIAIRLAKSAVRRFQRAKQERRKAFLTLLICPPRN
jgi:uncharacterized protein (UPF0332 family)